GETLCEAARGRKADVDRAVQAAVDALPLWANKPVAERRLFLFELARRLMDPRIIDELALLECLNTGKPLREAREDVVRTAAACEFYGGLVDKLFGTTIPISSDVL